MKLKSGQVYMRLLAVSVAAVPSDVDETDLYGWPFGKLCRQIFEDQIEAAIAVINLETKPEDRMNYIPICEMEYIDGRR